MYDDITLYGKFTKVNEDKKIVEGWASTEALDSQGEVVKFEAIQNALEPYMEYGNIREMHQMSAVGRAVKATADEERRGLWVQGKVVDDNAWQKVKEKVYNGFSIGGKVKKKVGNEIRDLVLSEISLVDRPANPEATFNLVKIEDGKVVGKEVDKKIEKSLKKIGVKVDGMSGLPSDFGIKIAAQMLSTATNFSYLIETCEEMERPTKHLQKVVSALKAAAMTELKSEKAALVEGLEKSKEKEKAETLEVLEEAKEFLKSTYFKKGWSQDYFESLQKNL